MRVGVETEPHPGNLGELSAGCRANTLEADGVLHQQMELLRREGEEGQPVVEPQGALDVELGNVTGAFSGLRDRHGGQEENVGLTGGAGGLDDRADVVADAAAVLQGNGHFRVNEAGHPQVGIGGEAAQVGLLGTHVAAPPGQVYGGPAVDVGVPAAQDHPQGFGDAGHFGDWATGEGLAFPPLGGVGAADVGVDGFREDMPPGVEVHHQSAQVSVIAPGVDHQHRLPTLRGEDLRVFSGALVSGPQPVGLVGEDGVGAAGDDNVHVLQQAGQLRLDGDELHVGEEDDLVDALRRQRVHLFLNDGGQRGDTRVRGWQDGDVPSLGEPLQSGGGGADDADALSADRDNRAGGHASGNQARFLPARNGQSSQVPIVPEQQVGGEVGKGSARVGPVLAGVVAYGGGKDAGALVELVVAQGGCLQTHGVEQGDIAASLSGDPEDGSG